MLISSIFSAIGNWVIDALINVLAMIDGVLYSLLAYLYQIFFNVSSANILSGETVKALFSRVQLILGVAIVFKLAITLINGIIDPDKITDKKSGAGKMVTRIVTSMVLLLLIVPLNIPSEDIEDGSYESQLNNNGILFGTLYEFQNRVLSDNTLARLILGKESTTETLATSDSMENMGKRLSVIILKSFVTVNMADGKDGEDPRVAANRVCSDDASQELVEDYLDNDNNVYAILNHVTARCKDNNTYIFNYMFLISTAAMVLILLIMIGFTLDIGIRTFKMSILRLVGPVPIISYVDPKSGDKNLEAWSKSVSKTYLDIFLRVAVVFFILFVIEEFTKNGVSFSVQQGTVYGLSFVILVIALFYFAREAPKFILESMGFKYEGGYFSGIGKMFGAGQTALRAVGSGIASAKANVMARNAKHVNAGMLRKAGIIATSAIPGAFGAVGGAVSGLWAAGGAKDHYGRAASQAISQRNALKLAQADAGSTWGGRMQSSLSRMLFGESPAESGKRDITNMEAQIKALEAIEARVKGEMVKQDWTHADVQDSSGRMHNNINFKRFKAQLEQAKADGRGSFDVQDYRGISTGQSISVAEAEMMLGNVEKDNQAYYMQEVAAGTATKLDGSAFNDNELMSLIQDAEAKRANDGRNIRTRSDYKDAIEQRHIDIAKLRRKNATDEQNDRFAQANKK